MLETTSPQGPLVVLDLSDLVPPCDFVQWHWRSVAGVPFLLRNLLTLQRSGTEKALVYLGNQHEAGAVEDLGNKLQADPRLKIKWDLIAENFQPARASQLAHRVLILDGRAVHDRVEVAAALRKLDQKDGHGPWAVETLSATSENRIEREEDFLLQHNRLLRAGGGLGNDSLITRWLSRTVSTRLTRLVIDTALTPNQVTLFSFLLGLLAAWRFFQGGYWPGVMGGALLVFSTWVDGVDGELARLKFMESKLGAKLDIYCDNIVHFVLFLAIGLGLAKTMDRELYALLGIIAAIGSLLSFFMLNALVTAGKSTDANSSSEKSEKPKPTPNLAEKMANRDFIHLLFLLALFGRVDVFLWLTAIGVTIFTLYLVFLRIRSSGQGG